METKLIRIAEIAKEKPKEVFTSLYHLLNVELLLRYQELKLLAYEVVSDNEKMIITIKRG